MTEKAKKRKNTPVYSGVINYFPDAIREVARVSKIGNDQHHPDKPLHWDKPKSSDHEDAMLRHLMDHKAGIIWDDDTATHLGKVAWRALAMLQVHFDKLKENERFLDDTMEYDKALNYDEETVEKRMDIIGQNGNTGEHYDATLPFDVSYETVISDRERTVTMAKPSKSPCTNHSHWSNQFGVGDDIEVGGELFRIDSVGECGLKLTFIEE